MCPDHRRLCINSVYLVLILSPLRMIDGIDPPLCLNNHTPILFNVRCVLTVLLALLDWYGTILATAAVYLQALLIRLDVHLDARHIRGQGKHGQVR